MQDWGIFDGDTTVLHIAIHIYVQQNDFVLV